jgi:hypothetical protein
MWVAVYMWVCCPMMVPIGLVLSALAASGANLFSACYTGIMIEKTKPFQGIALVLSGLTVLTVLGYDVARARDFWIHQERPSAAVITMTSSNTAIDAKDRVSGARIQFPAQEVFRLTEAST